MKGLLTAIRVQQDHLIFGKSHKFLCYIYKASDRKVESVELVEGHLAEEILMRAKTLNTI